MKYFGFLSLILEAAFGCSNALAMTYYVDATNGNDGWSGTTSTVSTTNGPWQSIAKVNSESLQPGDQVLFSCGQTWSETLNPGNDGTAANKIYFGSFPLQCADKPKISGFRSISGFNWQPYQGNIWKTTFPQNLIINGSLSASVDNWSKWPSDASQTFESTCPLSTAGCMNFLGGTSSNSNLAISNSFPVVGGKKHVLTFSFFAPSDTSGNLIVRENGNSYRTLGLVKTITGSNQWQNINVEFTSTQTLANARLDIEVPKAKRIYIQSVQLQETGVLPKPNMVIFDGDPVTIAHHPNTGYDISRPDSVYLRTTAPSPTITDSNGHQFSSQIVVPDLKLPPGVSVEPDTKLILRTMDWKIDDFVVTGVGENTLSITPNTSYPLSQAGWGFYFYDALWMLDSPGEWFFDNTTQTLYLWTPTNQIPDNRTSIATIDTAIDLRNKSNLTVENLEIDGAATGVDIANSTNVTLQNLNIHNISNLAIGAQNSINDTISTNQINRTGVDGIRADYSTNGLIENNVMTEVGIFEKADKLISIPMQMGVGIQSGFETIISNNLLSDIAGNAINVSTDNDVDSNIIQRSCIIINDCGAITLAPLPSLKTAIRNNLILEVLGNMDGTPDKSGRIANGIYLDNGTSNISVIGNTVKGGTNAIHIHNGHKNTISNNILYGSVDRLIWQQETSQSGDIYGNIITENQFFTASPNSLDILSATKFGSAENFATYDYNHYSTIYSPIIAVETAVKGSIAYSLEDWQTAETLNGIQRNNDINGNAPAPIPLYARGIVGQNFITNGNFSDGINAWGSWNAVAPSSVRTLEGCLPVSVNCMHVIAGASETLINSPKFAVTKDEFYRVTFDLMSSVDNAQLNGVIHLAGPTKYDILMQVPALFSTSQNWQRHSFVFQATASAANPTINDQGARFDIEGIQTGQSLWVANLEIRPFDPGVVGLSRSDLLVNITDTYTTIDCPIQLTNPGLCSSYVSFPEGVATIWPISVPPRSGRIVFTQNLNLPDTDSDGIADSQDDCPGTLKGLEVNGRGCSLFD